MPSHSSEVGTGVAETIQLQRHSMDGLADSKSSGSECSPDSQIHCPTDR